jgi:hypothetical protein
VQNNIVNAERRGKRQVLIRPSSKVVVKFLSVMQRHGKFITPACLFYFTLYLSPFNPDVITT